MLKSLYLVDENGDVIIEKPYVGDVTKNDIEPALMFIKNGKNIPSILESFGLILLIHREKEMFFVGAVDKDESIMLFASQYIVNIAKMISSFFVDGLTYDNVKTNYPMIYKVFDQSVDHGFPFLDEPSTLIASFSGTFDSILSIDKRFPWRSTSKIHGSPEFYINVVESIDLHVSGTGIVNLNYVRGSVNIFCKVPGNPVVSLTSILPEKFDEVCYHRCVDPKLHLSRRIQFIPCDGSFCLMKYVAKPNYNQVPLFVTPRFSWSNVSMTFEISLRVNQTLPQKLNDIVISFVLPKGVESPSLASPRGTVKYIEENRTVQWTIEASNSGSAPLILNGSASVIDIEEAQEKSIFINAAFSAKGYTASGLSIENFEIVSTCKNITKGIKYTTKAGNYDFVGYE